jgi:hypothetical protein
MLDVTRDRLGYDGPLTIIQGSYHPTGGPSEGTHDGGGTVDLAPFDADHKVHALRALGFAAWHRLPIPGLWDEHIHAVAIGDKQLSPAARAQVSDYYAHRDGLADNAPDPTWHPEPVPAFDFARWRKENTLLKSDKRWLDKRFDTLHQQLATFRENTLARDQHLARRIDAISGQLSDTATREQVRRARADLAEIKALLESPRSE